MRISLQRAETRLSNDSLPAIVKQRLSQMFQQLKQPVINLEILKELVLMGIPDEYNQLRKVSWLLALKILPNKIEQWSQTQQFLRNRYNQYLREFIKVNQDYPTKHTIRDQSWPEFKEDYTLWQQIQKDILRTHSEKQFFNRNSEGVQIPYMTSARKQKFKFILTEQEYSLFLKDKETQRRCFSFDHMSRILYIWGKLNRQVKYVQGMNQILAPIFYLFNFNQKTIVQAQCFFLFNQLIGNFMEILMMGLDREGVGLYGRLYNLCKKLQKIQPQVIRHLNQLNVTPEYYGIKWVVMMFAQNYQLFDVIKLWDGILFSQNVNDYIDLICAAIMSIKSKQLVKSDFHNVMRILNRFDDIPVQQLINAAASLQKKWRERESRSMPKRLIESLKSSLFNIF